MILKLRVPEYVGSVVNSGGWKYVDGVERVTTHGPIIEDRDIEEQHKGEPRVFGSYAEVREYVAHAWGDANSRAYSFELWPEWPHDRDFARFLTIAVLHLYSGAVVLAVLTEDCYLLGPNGDNIDRLCASGQAFPVSTS